VHGWIDGKARFADVINVVGEDIKIRIKPEPEMVKLTLEEGVANLEKQLCKCWCHKDDVIEGAKRMCKAKSGNCGDENTAICTLQKGHNGPHVDQTTVSLVSWI